MLYSSVYYLFVLIERKAPTPTPLSLSLSLYVLTLILVYFNDIII